MVSTVISDGHKEADLMRIGTGGQLDRYEVISI